MMDPSYYYNYDKNSNKLRKHAIFVTSVTTLALTLAATIVAVISKSSATYAFAANSGIDLVSCIIVFWRYYDKNAYLSTNNHQHSKEKKTCICLGSMFIISAVAVIGKAIYDLIVHSVTSNIEELILLSSVAIFLCFVLIGVKFWLYIEMLCDSIYHDAISSIINLMFAILIIFSSEMIRFDEKYWYLDPAGSFILAIVMIIYGLYVIISTNMYREQKQTWTYTSLA